MTIKEQKRMHAALDVSQLDDKELEALVSSVLQTVPNGTLYANNAAIQASVTGLSTAHDAYKSSNDAVNATQAKLEIERQNQSDARFVLVNGVVQLKTLVETTARTEAELKGAGFSSLNRQQPGAIEIPGVAIFVPKRGLGRVKVTATVTGNASRFDAQYCLDPMAQNTWTDLDGYGRSHWLTTFKSGAVVWVRFRTLRGHSKSDWCAPVSVTIP